MYILRIVFLIVLCVPIFYLMTVLLNKSMMQVLKFKNNNEKNRYTYEEDDVYMQYRQKKSYVRKHQFKVVK